jgi:hypothetical protein
MVALVIEKTSIQGKLPPLAKSVYLDCKNNYAFAKITSPTPSIISKNREKIESLRIFVQPPAS